MSYYIFKRTFLPLSPGGPDVIYIGGDPKPSKYFRSGITHYKW
jgi:hypothetical protein